MDFNFYIIFFIIIFILIHSYLLYPIIIRIVSYFYKEVKLTNISYPSISILISAYNEEKVINERIQNIASLNYNFNDIEVLVGSDCSSDTTNEILLKLEKEYSWLKVFLFTQRRGKLPVLNDLVKKAHNQILVFTDANTKFIDNSLLLLGLHFNDLNVGGVSGRLILLESQKRLNQNIEEKKYWNYETYIKKYEGKCGILIGANGGIFAIRKNLYTEIPDKYAVTDDLFLSLSILRQKFKFLYAYDATASEEIPQEMIYEFKRKLRFASTNFQTLFYFKDLLFSKNILLSYAFWSHKVFRWFSPILFLILIILNIVLYNYGELLKILLYIQIMFYLFSFLGYLLMKFNLNLKIFSIPFYFTMTNIAIFMGFMKFIFKKQTAFWQSTPRN